MAITGEHEGLSPLRSAMKALRLTQVLRNMNFKVYKTRGISAVNTKAVSKLRLNDDEVVVQVSDSVRLRIYGAGGQWTVALHFEEHDKVMHPSKGTVQEAFKAFYAVLRALKYGLDPRAAQYAAVATFEQMKSMEQAIVEAAQHATNNTSDGELQQQGYEQARTGVWTRHITVTDHT